MSPRLLPPTHPGEVLGEEFLKPMGLPMAALARHLGVPASRIRALVHGQRGVDAELAWLLSMALGTSPRFWMNLQVHHDLAACKPARKVGRLTPD